MLYGKKKLSSVNEYVSMQWLAVPYLVANSQSKAVVTE